MTLFKFMVSILGIICLFVISGWAAKSVNPITELLDNSWFLEVNANINNRTALYDFDLGDTLVAMHKNTLVLWGLGLGRRHSLQPFLRWENVLRFGFGVAADDTLHDQLLTNSQQVDIAIDHQFVHVSFSPTLQLITPHGTGPTPFIYLGGAVNLMHMTEKIYELDNPKINILLSDKPVQVNSWSLSAKGGAGVDLSINHDFGLSIVYSITYWQPVTYPYDLNLPSRSINCTEQFWSHGIHLVLLFRKRD